MLVKEHLLLLLLIIISVCLSVCPPIHLHPCPSLSIFWWRVSYRKTEKNREQFVCDNLFC
jgi:hypothetical protein